MRHLKSPLTQIWRMYRWLAIPAISYRQIFKAGNFFSEVLPWSLTKPQMMTLFYVARLISGT